MAMSRALSSRIGFSSSAGGRYRPLDKTRRRRKAGRGTVDDKRSALSEPDGRSGIPVALPLGIHSSYPGRN